MEESNRVVCKYDTARMHNGEEKAELLLKILKLSNTPGDKNDIIHEILVAIQLFTNFEAVGIRLKKDLDFPYYIAIGFPAHIIDAKRYLCKQDGNGELIRSRKNGNPVQECMCGNIIRSRFDPSLEFFTRNGSFWTNSISGLLANTDEEERQGMIRNRCNSEGYESVALIPLKNGKEIIGLLQLNDKQQGMLSENYIDFLEGVSLSIGALLSKNESEESLQKTKIQLQLARDEKDVMMKEIHHRVKNNLQIIISLLNIQERNIGNEEIREIIREPRNRIQAIALVHERLYNSDDLARIDFNSYIKALVRELMYTYDCNSEMKGINIESENIQLKIEQAIPTGIIFTELITNAIKYALLPYPDKYKPITIHLKNTFDNKFEFMISDNGPGIQDDYKIDNVKTPGLMLVSSLVRQLNGTITMHNNKGTTYVIRFKKK